MVKGCQKANRRSQEEVFRLYSDQMFRISYRYTRNQPEAEDVMIRSFTKVFEQIASFQFRGDGSLAAWIRKIVVNESLMWLRRTHNFRMTESIEDRMLPVDLSQANRLSEDDIYKLVTQLPTGYRTVFNLAVVEGYNHQEVAELLGIEESTSRSQLFKAKNMLKVLLAKEGLHFGT